MTAFHLRTPSVSQMKKPLLSFGISESKFIAPRSRGRSAVYRMARTPYSRAQPAGALQVFKHRYSILENGIGSVVPIRRIRQKSNLLHTKRLAVPSSSTHLSTQRITSDAGRSSSSFMQRPNGYCSLKSQSDMVNKNAPISASPVSPKSSEMGERILQQLEKLAQPKQKLSCKKPGVSGASSFMVLTPDMLHGRACRSLETVDTLWMLENIQDNGNEVGSVDPAACKMQTSALPWRRKTRYMVVVVATHSPFYLNSRIMKQSFQVKVFQNLPRQQATWFQNFKVSC